jgi:hypothetical protein
VVFFICACGHNESRIEIIPAKYDLRNHNLVTPVKDQSGKKPDGTSDFGSTVGLCWAFSSLASLESNMLKQGITSDPLSAQANLSPWYLGNYIGFNRPWYEFNAETIPDLEPSTPFGYYEPGYGWGGGGSFWTADYLIAGKELPTWNDCPMPTDDQTARRTLNPPSTSQTKKYNIARMSLIFADDFPGLTHYRNRIKRYILENGAIQSFIHLEAIDNEGMTRQIVNGVEYVGFRFMDKANFNMYTYETDNLGSGFLTHAIAIVGWDDARVINVGGHATTGAWLIKDSQSDTSWNNGYFWVAYDDLAINVMASGLVADTENYEHQSRYQTHPGILSNLTGVSHCNDENCLDWGGEHGYLLNGYDTGVSWGFAEFPLSIDERLAAVGIFSGNRNQKVTIRIYKNNLQPPPLLTKKFTLDEIGYHLLKLGTDIRFQAGETMIIGVGFEHAFGHNHLPLAYVQNDEHDFLYPTYFGRQEGRAFQLTAYSEIDPHRAFFLQAIVRKKSP